MGMMGLTSEMSLHPWRNKPPPHREIFSHSRCLLTGSFPATRKASKAAAAQLGGKAVV